jgi:hypothetical protein
MVITCPPDSMESLGACSPEVDIAGADSLFCGAAGDEREWFEVHQLVS